MKKYILLGVFVLFFVFVSGVLAGSSYFIDLYPGDVLHFVCHDGQLTIFEADPELNWYAAKCSDNIQWLPFISK